MSDDLKTLGAAIRRARLGLGLQQHELADMAGLTRSSIANIESGRQDTTVSKLAAIAAHLHTTVGALLGEHPPARLPEVLILLGYQIRCQRCGPLGFAVDHDEAREFRTTHLRRDHLEML